MSERLYHRRVIDLHYCDEDLPTFTSDAEMNAWYQALGRMVAFGMHNDKSTDTVELITGGLTTRPYEICLTYHPRLPAYDTWPETGEKKYLGSPDDQLHCLVKSLRDRMTGSGFTMGAVLHNDGHWGFHS